MAGGIEVGAAGMAGTALAVRSAPSELEEEEERGFGIGMGMLGRG